MRSLNTLNEAFDLAMQLRDLDQRVTGLCVLSGRSVASNMGPVLLVLRLEGAPDSLDAASENSLIQGASHEVLDGEDAQSLWADLDRFPETQGFQVELAMSPSKLKTAAQALVDCAESDQFGVVADPLSGILRFTLPECVRDNETTVGQLILSRLTRDLPARCNIRSDPLDAALSHARFGAPAPAQRALMQRVRRSLDPQELMGQGRDQLVKEH